MKFDNTGVHLICLLITFSFACKSSNEQSKSSGKKKSVDGIGSEDGTASTSGDECDPSGLNLQTASPTWESGIEELIEENCVSCHDEGEQDPELVDYSSVSANADDVLESVKNGDMPPSKKLSANLVDQLEAWVKNGAPKSGSSDDSPGGTDGTGGDVGGGSSGSPADCEKPADMGDSSGGGFTQNDDDSSSSDEDDSRDDDTDDEDDSRSDDTDDEDDTSADDGAPFGGASDVEYSKKLWKALGQNRLVGDPADIIKSEPRIGEAPHGAIVEVVSLKISVGSYYATAVIKRNYSGDGISKRAVQEDRDEWLKAVTVMFKRERGYDSDNKNWFWVKYKPDGSLDKNADGVSLAGRVAKGNNEAGCIACHSKAEGGDFLWVNDP